MSTVKPPLMKGYRPTWPEGDVVPSVDGVITDDVVASGVRVVWDTVSEQIFRLVNGVWRSVSGKVPLTLPYTEGGYALGYEAGY